MRKKVNEPSQRRRRLVNEARCNAVTIRSYQFTMCGYRRALSKTLRHGNGKTVTFLWKACRKACIGGWDVHRFSLLKYVAKSFYDRPSNCPFQHSVFTGTTRPNITFEHVLQSPLIPLERRPLICFYATQWQMPTVYWIISMSLTRKIDSEISHRRAFSYSSAAITISASFFLLRSFFCKKFIMETHKKAIEDDE